MEKGSASIVNAATGSASRAVRQVRSVGDTGQSTNSSSAGATTSGATKQAVRGASTATTATPAGGSSSNVIKFKTTFRNTIFDTMLRRGWKETTDNDWDFYWADREYIYELLDTVHLENNQRVNHYRNGREVRKACKFNDVVEGLT
jgi:hypothetical protein